jgi:ketosteroid isomerase-like protein
MIKMDSKEASYIEAVEASIRERSDVFEQYFRSGEAEELVRAYYVDDALTPLFSMPDKALISGRQAITGAFETIMQAFSDCRLEQVKVHADGDLAHELGRCDLTTNDGEAMTARYSILWRRSGDGWRVQSDLFAFGDLR